MNKEKDKPQKRWDFFLEALRETPEEKAPAGFEAGVKARIRAAALPAQPRPYFRWALWPAAAVLVAALTSFWFRPARGPAQVAALPPSASPVVAREMNFRLSAAAARSVSLVGDFNGWETSALPLRKDGSGTWVAAVALEPGSYQYQFVVDEERFMADPGNPVRIPDGFGGFNSGVEL